MQRIAFDNNTDYIRAIFKSSEMKLESLQPFSKLNIVLTKASEIEVAADYIKRLKSENNTINLLKELYKMRVALPATYELYAAIETFPCSTAVCESSFSALSQIGWGIVYL